MAKDIRVFTGGKMNKELDERLVPQGEYIDALNIRVGSTESDDMGVAENSTGNISLTNIEVQNTSLSTSALCIGAFEDGAEETLYWFVHDSAFPASANTSKLDLILSFNTNTQILTYHVISMDDGGGVNTTLNFNPQYLITGVNKIDNFLFFTDDYNPPRKINVLKDYGNPDAITDVDGFNSDDILVIKKPPTTSPTVVTKNNPNIISEFLDERYICFAYRWRYDDNEYSATSQFSLPAFTPKSFEFTPKSYLNEGMTNKHNVAEVTFNTGGSLVKGIDLLFKEAGNDVIKVIEKLDKDKLGYGDNSSITFNFSDSKIFTILPESEIFRTYDNVPKLAQAQTIMGNRLMYGNYEEGYDLIDKNGNATELNYVATLNSTQFEIDVLPSTDVTYNNITYPLPVAAGGTSEFVEFAQPQFNLESLIVNNDGTSRLVAGATFDFTFNFEDDDSASQYIAGPTPEPSQSPQDFSLSVSITLSENYNSLADFIASNAFKNQMGTFANIKPVSSITPTDETSCSGGTLTDNFNCAATQELGVFSLYTTGIQDYVTQTFPQPISTSAEGNLLFFVFPGLWYVDDITTPLTNYFRFYRVGSATASFRNTPNARSLHSNRGYETSIIYMDEFGRSTTALVSPNNAVQVSCDNSELKNQIKIEIPTSQIAPSWATHYKFAVKPDEKGYNTIFANLFFTNTAGNKTYILLQGENARKVEEGDRYIVKRDVNGPLSSCSYVTVLEKVVLSSEDLTDPNSPAGVYMVVHPSDLNFTLSGNTFIDVPTLNASSNSSNRRPYIFLPLNLPISQDAGCEGTDYTIPVGSIIKITILSQSVPTNGVPGELPEVISVQREFTATAFYENLREWFLEESIGEALVNGNDFFYVGNFSPSQSCPEGLNYNNQTATDIALKGVPEVFVPSNRIAQFTYGSRDFLGISGKTGGGVGQRNGLLSAKLIVTRFSNVSVFETLPEDANPDLFYESSESFTIDTVNGFHLGNVQDQTASQSAIIDTDFFNCFTFGNGVESYRIRDSIVGDTFQLGNRATATLGKDYKQVRRFADITYSGVYNQESNVNKTNEFNLGLFNFKPLEQSFGPIQKMFARETDILTLQEDKISYVMSSKNVLSSAAGGGNVAAIPEVLGNQVARIEEFGISENPESFAVYGYDKFFTDAKRGSVIQLRGTASSNESLNVISGQGMRTWFRELFQVSFDYQKLGGYDPYMQEYVLSSNLRKLPEVIENTPCGTTQTFTLAVGEKYIYTIDLTAISEEFEVSYNFFGAGSISVITEYDGVSYGGTFTVSGSYAVPKPDPRPLTAQVTLSGNGVIQVTIGCPVGTRLNVIQVCLTSANDANALIHNEFNFRASSIQSPTQSSQIQFSTSVTSPIVSQFDTYTGFQGQGYFPSDGSVVSIITNKLSNDTFIPSVKYRYRYLRTGTTYANTPSGRIDLLTASTAITPTGSNPLVKAGFIMPSGTDENLYLVYDYRDAFATTDLCYNLTDSQVACCCTPSSTYYLDGDSLSSATAVYTDSAISIPAAAGWYSDGVVTRYQALFGSLPSLTFSQNCEICDPSGDGTISTDGSTGMGLYDATYDIGAATGAMILVYNPNSVPNGILAEYNSVKYNKLSSQTFGKLQSTVGTDFTVAGQTASQCSGVVGTTNYLKYAANGSKYQLQSGSQSVTIASGDLNLTATTPGSCVMVIPKLTATPSTVNIDVIAPCDNGLSFDITLGAPVVIGSILTSLVSGSSLAACGLAQGTKHNIVHTDGTTGGTPTLFAYVFTDDNGANPAANGFIAYLTKWYKIDDGIITATGSC